MIRYSSTTYVKGTGLIASSIATVLFGVYVYSVYSIYEYQIPYKNKEFENFIWWLIAGAAVIPSACIYLIVGNVLTNWEISESGIHESISPKWKKIPFGHYQERFIQWDEIVSYDDSKTIANTLQGVPERIVIKLKSNHSLKITKNKSLSDESFQSIVESIKNHNNDIEKINDINKITAPAIARNKSFWRTNFGKATALLISIFVIGLILIDITSEDFMTSSKRLKLYLIFLPTAAVACLTCSP